MCERRALPKARMTRGKSQKKGKVITDQPLVAAISSLRVGQKSELHNALRVK